MKKVRSIFLLACCGLIAIGPLNLMQLVAWGTMLRDYADDRSLSEAADMTFSGEYPCEMCRKIAEARMKENQPDQPGPAPSEERKNHRLDIHFHGSFTSTTPRWLTPAECPPGEADLLAEASRHQRVPTPPPRLLS
jgi:hypothetical protein